MATRVLRNFYPIRQVSQTVQIHPRVLKEDHNCCDCQSFSPIDQYCHTRETQVSKYDECPAFMKVTE